MNMTLRALSIGMFENIEINLKGLILNLNGILFSIVLVIEMAAPDQGMGKTLYILKHIDTI